MEKSTDGISVLMIPPFPEEAEYLRCKSYGIRLRIPGGEWQDILPYKVQIDPDYVQNMTPEDVYLSSPMVYFDLEGSVEVEISKIGYSIANAKVHPESKLIDIEFCNDGKIRFTLNEPRTVCVSINGNRQDMVYLIIHPPEKNIPDFNDPDVVYIGPGVTSPGRVETEVWNGKISDISVYDDDLSDEQIRVLAKSYDYGKYYEFDGYKGHVVTEHTIDLTQKNLGVSVWVYRNPDRTSTVRTIINGYISLRSDGRPTTLLGEWMYPLTADTPIGIEKWDHIFLRKQSDVFTFFVNGEVAGSMKRNYPKDLKFQAWIGSGRTLESHTMKENQTLYLAAGAILSGSVIGYGVSNITVRGRGMIDMSRTDYKERGQGIGLTGCRNVVLDGVIVNDSRSISTHLCETHDIVIRNYTIFSSYGASDGVHLKSSTDLEMYDSFIRVNDDSIAVYGSCVVYVGPSNNVNVHDCILISDAGHMVMAGILAAAYEQERISGLRFRNLDIIDSKCQYEEYQGVIGLNAGNDAVIEDAVFENIRIEEINRNQLFNLRIFYNSAYCVSPGFSIKNIVFRNITYNGGYKWHVLPSQINGEDENRIVEDVLFEDIYINGKKCLSLEEAEIVTGKYTRNIRIV